MGVCFNGKLILAPMAGVTDSVYRTICRCHGADIVVSEMVSAEGLCHNPAGTYSLLEFAKSERPIGIQLFGARPRRLAEAARYVEEHAAPDFIDLNCGCPVPKVVKSNGGSALLKDPKLFADIVTGMVKAVSIPVTVKIRSGWATDDWVDVEFALIAEECGAQAITVHPRSRTMGFSGRALWDRIGAVKQAVGIPVLGNGDITTPTDAARMLSETGCDSIMIGRAAQGNPWIFSQTRAALSGEKASPVSRTQRIRTASRHLREYRERHGENRASAEMKKHLGWYLRGLPGAGAMRRRIFSSQCTEDLERALQEARDSSHPPIGSGKQDVSH